MAIGHYNNIIPRVRLVRRAREAARGTAAARARLAWTRPAPPGLTVCPYPGMMMVMMMIMMMTMMTMMPMMLPMPHLNS